LLIADDYESAVEEWQSIGAIGCILRLGEQYLSERRWDRAVVAFTAARALEPSSEEISLKLARALLREDRDPTSTIGLLTEIIAAKPSECEAYGMLGTACRNGGDLAQARTWYIEAVRVCPGDAGTWLDLGRFLLLWDNNTEAALPAVQTTLALDPNSAEGRVLLGIYSYRHGDLTGALNEVRRGIDLDPGGGWFYVVLGDIYRDLGQRLAARTAYERAIELGSEVEYARRQLQALDQ
jgi:cytochrome c-type biogenesis protein CcmH/NrfG